MGKKLIFGIFIFILLSGSVFGQFDFGYRYGSSRSSGFSNIISSTLDFIFGGVIEPVMDAIRFNNFEAAVKLGLWIILYMLFSLAAGKYFSGLPKKFSKIIAAIVGIFFVVFIPNGLLDVLFREILGGIIGYLLFAIFIVVPIWRLIKWSRDHKEDRAVNLISAGGFLVMMTLLSYFNQQVVYTLPYGVIQTLGSLTIAIGSLTAFVFFIHRIYLGLKGLGGGETNNKENEEEPRQGRDEFEGAKSLANQLIQTSNEIRDHIQNTPDDAQMLANQLLRHQDRLNYINVSSMTHFNNGITRLSNMLEKSNGKNKRRAKELASKIIEEYNDFHESVEEFSSVRRKMGRHLTEVQGAISAQTTPNYAFFGDLIGRLRTIDKELKVLVANLSKINSL